MATVCSGRSAAWLAHLLWEQRVARSNRVAPILFDVALWRRFFFLVFCFLVRTPSLFRLLIDHFLLRLPIDADFLDDFSLRIDLVKR